MKKILIIGSNFGSRNYLKAINKLYKKKIIHICSPNIYKKNIDRNLIKHHNYNYLINNNNYDLIICATTPKVQYQFISKFILTNKKKTRLMLEKPLAHNSKSIFKIYHKLINKKIIFNQNFIFPKIKEWEDYNVRVKKNETKNIIYQWYFEQAYFKNYNKTWKIDVNEGGGLILFYMSHIIFNILLIDENLKFEKIISYKKSKKYLTQINLILSSKKTLCQLEVDIKSKKRLHHFFCFNEKNYFSLKNQSNSWTKKFYLKTSENHKIKKSKEDRDILTLKNLKDLFKFNYRSAVYRYQLEIFNKTYNLLKKIENNLDV